MTESDLWEEAYLRLDESHKAQMARAEKAEAEVERLRTFEQHFESSQALLAENIRLRDTIARVEALVPPTSGDVWFHVDVWLHVSELRAALRGPEPTEDGA